MRLRDQRVTVTSTPPPTTSPPSYLTLEEVVELRQFRKQFNELRDLIERCATTADSQSHHGSRPTLATIPVPTSQRDKSCGSQNVHETNSKSTAKLWYPHIQSKLLESIADGTFHGEDLFKLSKRVHSSNGRSYSSSTDTDSGSHDFLDSFPDIVTFLDPWLTYVTIRSLFEPQTAPVLNAYSTLLLTLERKFEWHAVLNYHFSFFAARLAGNSLELRVAEGLAAEEELCAKYLTPHPLVRRQQPLPSDVVYQNTPHVNHPTRTAEDTDPTFILPDVFAAQPIPTSVPPSINLPAEGTDVAAVAVHDYKATKYNELSFNKGDLIFEIVVASIDWWEGKDAKGNLGLFPADHVETIDPIHHAGNISGPAIQRNTSPFSSTVTQPAGEAAIIPHTSKDGVETTITTNGGSNSMTLAEWAYRRQVVSVVVQPPNLTIMGKKSTANMATSVKNQLVTTPCDLVFDVGS